MVRKIVMGVVIGFIAFMVGMGIVVNLYVDWQWFKEVSYESVFLKILFAQLKIFFAGLVIAFTALFVNLVIVRAVSKKSGFVESNIVQIDFLRGKSLWKMPFAVSIILAVIVAMLFLQSWKEIYSYYNMSPFGIADPIFKIDAGFYVFVLPFYKIIYSYVNILFFIMLFSVAIVYLVNGGVEFTPPMKFRMTPALKSHLSLIIGILLLIKALGYYLSIYGLMFSSRGVAFGASNTDVNVQIPVYHIQLYATLICSAVFFVNVFWRRLLIPLLGLAGLVVIAIFLGGMYPAVFQRFIVEPNEIEKESKYIQSNIKFTRIGYNLDNIEEREFKDMKLLTQEDLKANDATIDNIRVWDYRPLLQTFGQIQAIRLYYNFSEVDVDRYTIDGKYQQVMLSVRELFSHNLPEKAQTWINQKMKFTHGYGLVMNAVAKISKEGMPELLIKDVPPVSVSSDIEVKRPEVYFGENTADYAIVNTKEEEFDYPKGDKNVYCQYQGTGGIGLKSLWNKFAFAWKFGTLKFLLTDAITDKSKVLINRQIVNRINTIAPFLMYDFDPYSVVSDGRIYWVLDAYCYTHMFPYSERFTTGNIKLNYIRNSVKVVVDAYNGKTDFYIADATDPIVKTYQKIFPKLFKNISQMPEGIKSHVRYPEVFFYVQSHMYRTYHMRDPQVFYNKEDMWEVAQEMVNNEKRQIEPYYVIMKLPGTEKEEFILMLPFTPTAKNNMIAWMCARSDGDNYGKLLVYKFSKEKMVYGPMQIEARIDQDPEISKQITLWSQKGSNVIRGNLLIIPIEDNLLYVEPLYLQSENSQLPELKRVIVAYETTIAMEENLFNSLEKVFGAEVRSLQKTEKPKEGASVTEKIGQNLKEVYSEVMERYNKVISEMKKLEETLRKFKEK